MNVQLADGLDLDYLVREDRVHSAIFTDPRIFAEEIRRIFHQTWVFAAHDSEVPNNGDFKTVTIGRTPVIISRCDDGAVKVLVNRCRHRGAEVCERAFGNTKYFRCWYHGWTYKNSGELASVPSPDGYESDLRGSEFGLAEVPRIDSYRGFIFVSLSSAGPDLAEYLGAARRFIDMLADYSPTGQVEIRPNVVHKIRYQGNWKLVGMDGYHVYAVHASVVRLFQKRSDSTGSAVGSLGIEDPWSDKSRSRTRGFPYGHAALDLSEQRSSHAKDFVENLSKSPGGAEYVKTMIDRNGRRRAEDIISQHGDPHLGVFPNLQLIHDHIRVVVPIDVDLTEVHMYPVFLQDVPEEFNTARLRHHEDFYGPASFGSPDDIEIFERTQAGMRAEVNPWVNLGRGLGREKEDGDRTLVGPISDEVTQRAQIREWKRLMTISQ